MDKLLKQRLVGATILIALAVIFIPMLFDAPEDDMGDRQMRIEIPDPPSDRPPIRRMPLDPDASRTAPQDPAGDVRDRGAADAAGSMDRPSAQLVSEMEADRTMPPTQTPSEPDSGMEPESRAVEDAEAMSSEPESAVAGRPASVESARSRPAPGSGFEALENGGWVLQVATFGVEENADDLVEQLTRLGHVASVSRMVRGQTTLHRVVTGPYATRRDAERAKGQVEQTVTGVAPVVRGNPSAQESMEDGANRNAGYAVQVGSFASRNNAVRLLGQLEDQDFDAFIHEDVSGRRTIWRVRVGVTPTRDDASELLSEIADRTALEGLVVSHP